MSTLQSLYLQSIEVTAAAPIYLNLTEKFTNHSITNAVIENKLIEDKNGEDNSNLDLTAITSAYEEKEKLDDYLNYYYDEHLIKVSLNINDTFNWNVNNSNSENIGKSIKYGNINRNSVDRNGKKTQSRNETNIYTNITLDSNFTKLEKPEWHNIIDQVITYTMIINILNVMLAMGCAIHLKQVLNSLWPPFGILIGMCGQFIIIPSLGFGLALAFKLTPYEAMGCLVISCSPGGTFSNVYTYWMNGDLALSVVMTSCSSLLAFVGMPLNLWIYSSYYVGDKANNIVIPYMNILKTLAAIAGPVFIGMVIRHYREKVANIVIKICSYLTIILFVIAAVCWNILYYQVFLTVSPYIYLSAILLPTIAFILAYLLAFVLRRSHKVCRTIAIETSSQNMPVAASIIILSFSEPKARAEMLIFPSIYATFLLLQMAVCAVIFNLWKRHSKNYKKKYGSETNPSEREAMRMDSIQNT